MPTPAEERARRAVDYVEAMMLKVTPEQLGDALQIDVSQPIGANVTMPVVLRGLIELTRAWSHLTREQMAGR